MKKKNMLCYAATGALTAANVMGCNPFLPGVIAMVGSEELSKPVITGVLLAGCSCFMPYLSGVKYLCIGILILIGETMIGRMQGRLSIWLVATLAALATLFTGLAGEVTCLTRYGVYSIGLESAFTFGMVLTFKRLLHRLLMEKQKLLKSTAVPAEEKKEQLNGYARAMEKMSEVLCQRNNYVEKSLDNTQSVTRTIVPMASNVVAKGLLAIANAIDECGTRQVYACMGMEGEIADLECALLEKGVETFQYAFYKSEDGRSTLEFQAHTKNGGTISTKQIGRIASETFGISLAPKKEGASFIGKITQRVVLVEVGCFQVRFHTARVGKGESAVCGDNFTVLRKPEGRCVLALSDGMGYGQSACRQSETVLELLEELLNAGFSPKDAIPMMNGCLSASCEEGFMGTMDLCEIDEFSGVARFYKMGAPASYVIRKKRIECIEGPSLPAGALADSTCLQCEKKLYDGDYLVMVSDGVLNAFGSEEQFLELLWQISKGNPGAMSTQIIENVKQAGGTLLDDCMVLVAGVFQR